MAYSVDIDIDSGLGDFACDSIAPECAWAADDEAISRHIAELVEFALNEMHVKGDVEVSVSLVAIDRIHELNKAHRGIDSPTDVLSFPCDDPDEVEGQLCELGDIVLAPEVAFGQSREYGNTYVQELDLLTIHSVLHLLGYDHIDDADAEQMEAEERRLVAAWEKTR